ncbi:MAG TPA: PQQ-binding-like beta-propeller repeat protein [Bryobacteraceae bacterium]|nr:PQQ-binding-like beta-propeller repeat protein [Bryobacteraceae bacterium]
MKRSCSWITGAVLALSMLRGATLWAQSGTKNGEWPSYGGDTGSTRYSPLDQINAGNFSRLQVAWRFKTDNLGPAPEPNLEGTPLMVKGVLYATAGTRRNVIALDAATGELLWKYGENEGERGKAAPRALSGRGLAYWTDGAEERIIYVTPGYRMIALNAKTGARVTFFGKGGVVDLKEDDDQPIDPLSPDIGLHSAPVIANNVIVIGAAHKPGGVPKSKTNVKGYVRGFDAKTGRRLWTFHTIPKPGEPGLDTWQQDSWSYTGNTGSWGQASIDPDLNTVYIGVEMPTGDYYGGHRPGNNLYSESIVALDLHTGQRKWYYQYIHHGIWDMDNPCPPILADITIGGRTVKAVAQPTKQAFMYVLNRETGQPVWPIVEKPVEKGTVPGEWYSPTQPFPTKPPAFAKQGISIDDLIDFTPELRAEAVKLVARYKIGPMFTPPVVSNPRGPLATLTLATGGGGANWPGGSYDPETHVAYVSAQNAVSPIGLLPPTSGRSDMNFISGQSPYQPLPGPEDSTAGTETPGRGGVNVRGLPLIKPPYGTITAIDLNRGEILWQVAHGDTPDNIRDNPALKGLNIPRTGRPGQAGQLVTKTLLIAGEKGVATQADGRKGALLRAYDKATGKDAGAVYMPAPQSGSPMTYMVSGKQYIVVAISGQGYSAEYTAYKLPE